MPVSTTTAPTSGERRREAGRARFTKLLGFMLRDISHPEMASLADWATNELGCLHTSQLSHIRNAKMRMLGVKSLDALGLINQACFHFKANNREALDTMQVAAVTAKIEDIVSRYEPLVDNDRPLNAGDFMLVYLGHLDLDVLPTDDLDIDWGSVAVKFGPWLEELLIEKGMRTRQAAAEVRVVWTGPEIGKDKLLLVLSGVDDFTDQELPALWPHLTKVVSHLMDDEVSEDDLREMVTA